MHDIQHGGYGTVTCDRVVAVRECPRCGSAAHRQPRRLLDRIVGVFSPRYRYRCESWDCRWEGTLPAPRQD